MVVAVEQMKPTAAQLEKNPTNWESKGCCSSQAPCELWNKYHGKEKFFQDLPLQPPDYDLSMCCGCYKYQGTNTQLPDARTDEEEGPAAALGNVFTPPAMPSKMQLPTSEDGSIDPSQVQMQVPIGHLPDGWQACYDENGKIYYQNHLTQQTQWERPTPS
jgi:hypothetical protein